MKEIDDLAEWLSLLETKNSSEQTWFDTVKKLKQLEEEGEVVLYAGTYSFEEALNRPFCDATEFYFYTLPDRQGYHFFSNPFGSIAAILRDDEIFLKSHKRLYGKKYLTNYMYGHGDVRSGEYFNRKKKR